MPTLESRSMRHRSYRGRHLAVLLAAAALCGSGGLARAQNVLPSNGHVVAGSATIAAPNGKSLAITETSNRAVIDWNAFSVGPSNSVNFWQPSSTAAILNRVTGTANSTIAGTITANGQIFLVNPNGIAITKTGTVSVGGGFVASTLAIANGDFMSGNLNFTGNGASAAVANAGSIAVGAGGFAVLLGGTVANSGTIVVPLGKVALGSGEQATLDLNGDGFMQVAVPTGATTADGEALVTNSGKVVAAGGLVQMKAATVATAMRDAVNLSGVVAANSVSGHDGEIEFSGGPGGGVTVGGKLDVSAPVTGNVNGGVTIVDGAQVTVEASAAINASGAMGGTILIGASGKGGADKAQSTTIASGAQILAEGNPSVANSGGYIETSGDNLSIASGAVIDAAPGGTWLLDPTNLYITANGSPPTTDPDAGAVAASVINSGLGGGNVTLTTSAGATSCTGVACTAGSSGSQSGDITVAAGITWNNGNTLTLSAYNNININAEILITGAGGLVLTTNNAAANASAALNILMGQGSIQYAPQTAGQSLTINGNSYALLYDMTGVRSMNGAANGTYYALAAPISSSGTLPEAPVGNFAGTFNGLGNTISNLTINDTANSFVGLIAELQTGGVVTNLGLVGGSVTASAGNTTVGGLVGFDNAGTIDNTYATGAVTVTGQANYVGGLVGYDNVGKIQNSYATGTVSASGGTNVGGLVGYNNGGTIENAYAAVTVTGGANDGGLVGANAGTIENAYATGTVNGNGNAGVGGLVGTNFNTIENAYATGAVSGTGTFGGLVGSNDSTITHGYYDSDTTGQPHGVQADGSQGLTTAELTAALPTGSRIPSGATSTTRPRPTCPT